MKQAYVSVDVMADNLGVHPSTIYRWVKQTLKGDLDMPFHYYQQDEAGTAKPPWLFKPTEVSAWFEGYTGNPRPGWRPGEARG